MKIKTLDNALNRIVIILALVSLSSFCVLTFLFFFDRVNLLVKLFSLFPLGLPYLVSLEPLTLVLLLSIDYTTFGLIWEGWFLVHTNFVLHLTLALILFASFTGILLLIPLTILISLSRASGCETLGEAVKGLKALAWSTNEGKTLVIFMMVENVISIVLTLFLILSIYAVIPLGPIATIAIGLFLGITILITVLFVMLSYWRVRNLNLKLK